VILGDEPPEMIIRQAINETGSEPTFIERIELGRRVPQKMVSSPAFIDAQADDQIIPTLCDFFADIVNVEHPRHSHHGWVLTISGVKDGERVMRVCPPLPYTLTN